LTLPQITVSDPSSAAPDAAETNSRQPDRTAAANFFDFIVALLVINPDQTGSLLSNLTRSRSHGVPAIFRPAALTLQSSHSSSANAAVTLRR
jgi:hypothetical protein